MLCITCSLPPRTQSVRSAQDTRTDLFNNFISIYPLPVTRSGWQLVDTRSRAEGRSAADLAAGLGLEPAHGSSNSPPKSLARTSGCDYRTGRTCSAFGSSYLMLQQLGLAKQFTCAILPEKFTEWGRGRLARREDAAPVRAIVMGY